MQKVLRPLSVLLVLALPLVGCKKDKKEDPAPTRTQLLTGKNWKITAATVDPALSYNGTLVTNLFAQSGLFPDCSKDDIYRFDSPSTYKEDEAATKCISTATQTRVGSWSLSVDEKILTTSLPATSNQNPAEPAEDASYTLLDLTDNTMRATTVVNFGGTTDYTLTVTFTKQ